MPSEEVLAVLDEMHSPVGPVEHYRQAMAGQFAPAVQAAQLLSRPHVADDTAHASMTAQADQRARAGDEVIRGTQASTPATASNEFHEQNSPRQTFARLRRQVHKPARVEEARNDNPLKINLLA